MQRKSSDVVAQPQLESMNSETVKAKMEETSQEAGLRIKHFLFYEKKSSTKAQEGLNTGLTQPRTPVKLRLGRPRPAHQADLRDQLEPRKQGKDLKGQGVQEQLVDTQATMEGSQVGASATSKADEKSGPAREG